MDNEEFKITETGINPTDTSGEDNGDIYFSNIEAQTQPQEAEKTETAAAVQKKSPKRKKGQSIAGTYIFFIVVIAVSMVLSVYAVLCMNDILAITKSSSSVTISLSEPLDDTNKAVDLLADNGLIKCKNFCKLFAKYREYYVGAPYEAGVYYLNAKMGLEGMLQTMHGNNITAETVSITFPEGLSTAEIVDKLVANEVCDKAALLSVIQTVDFSYSMVSDLEAQETVPYRLEGYLFPDTYDFYVGESASSVIKKFLANGDAKITEEYRNRAKELGYSMYDIMTIASIIQAEAGSTEQMKDISAVIHNRLSDKTNYPYLQCDSTSDYIKNKVGPALSSTASHTADYYLTYYSTDMTSTVVGLPAGPIGNPGVDAIYAALYPSDIDDLFFFHDNKGNLYTAKNNTEFRNKVATYAPYLNY